METNVKCKNCGLPIKFEFNSFTGTTDWMHCNDTHNYYSCNKASGTDAYNNLYAEPESESNKGKEV